MGRWMRALNKKEEVVSEMAPNFLIYCSRHLPKNIRDEFPILLNLDLNSDKWTDELQSYKQDKISVLKNEIEKVRRILNKEEFSPKVDSEKILKFWTTNDYTLKDINNDIDNLKSFFKESIEQDLEVKIYL
ncbi:hypothetical protein D1816_22825 [Aquimarina sp. AD10]|uniref:hypothetical protein n=1 Tax=Aquimarina sp. AD10 TaxID=1714849 RepID=UPI000E523DCC|nr:hypothetical protein [Aquimarina sp. AD10]AXT63057.1 hypothetical protein D1816_22825 [Aquimarina sp. AD10]RKM96858.1 hypothetical protein D7033_15200 [Aquimarina sp. AD10]